MNTEILHNAVYRIEKREYIDDTLKGIGASKQSLVVGIVSINEWFITAESILLACLEVFVHLGNIETLPSDCLLVQIEIPDEMIETCKILDVKIFLKVEIVSYHLN